MAWTLHGQAASAGSGRITGRVFNPATRDYVRSAQVRIEGTERVVETESDGSFRFDDVPAGEVTLTVTYTGYTAAPERLTVAAGQTAVREINLTSTLTAGGERRPGAAGEAVQLQQFVVSSAREGDAKAIMDQRRNMNITTSVASDVFGDVADGNVGEFLKFLPGVDIEYQEAESRGPRLGGLDPQYTGVTIDGVNLASADAFVSYGATENGSVGGSVRSVGFESMSINSVESIEINRTLSPDMDANAAAGSINMKSKRAFDRKGRSFGFTLGAALNSDEFHLKRTWGPDERKHYKIRPNAILEYSDVFMDQRLGVRLNISESNSYSEEYRLTHAYNMTQAPTQGDTRPMVLTSLAFKDGPKFIGKFATTLTADFKASSRLTLSLSAIFNAYDTLFYSRAMTLNLASNNTNAVTGRATVQGDLLSVATGGGAANTAKNVGLGPTNANKLTNTITVYPSFEYRFERLVLTGVVSFSKSKNDYESIERGIARGGPVNGVAVDFRATRPSIQSAEWTVVQTGGNDWSNLANYTNPRITNEGRYAMNQNISGQLDAKYMLPFRRVPTFVKFGVKGHEETRKSDDLGPYQTWSYTGPGGGTTGSWAGYDSPQLFDTGTTNALTVANMPPQVDSRAIAGLFREHPEWFVRNATAANFYQAYIANHRDFKQTVSAGYGMANAKLTSKLQVQGGLRWENTVTEAKEFDPLPNADVTRAGHTIAGGQPTTIAGYEYKFFSQPRVTRKGEYDNLFPSFSLKYNATRALQAQFGYSRAISRAPINDLAGVWVIDEINQVITAPNPALKPELSNNYVGRVAYYFEPVGQFSVQVSQNDISDLRLTSQRLAAEALEFVEPEYENFDFIVTRNSEREWRFRGMEVAYAQSLSFLPGALRGTSVRVSYTRTYANERRPGLAPHKIAANLNWSYKKVSLGVGGIWLDDTPFTGNYGFYRKHNVKFDVNGAYRLSRRLSLYFQGRNALNQSHEVYQSPFIEGEGGVLQRMGNFGAAWVFGVKGMF